MPVCPAHPRRPMRIVHRRCFRKSKIAPRLPALSNHSGLRLAIAQQLPLALSEYGESPRPCDLFLRSINSTGRLRPEVLRRTSTAAPRRAIQHPSHRCPTAGSRPLPARNPQCVETTALANLAKSPPRAVPLFALRRILGGFVNP